MTYQTLHRQIEAQLEAAGCDSPAFESFCLLEHASGMTREALLRHSDDTPPDSVRRELEEAAGQRVQGRPLQYILGEWGFLTLTLAVGEGVLIPRPDTEILCETAADRLKGRAAPRVLDLCAGSGCVGLGIASLCPGAAVTAVEVSEQALAFLKRNCARYPAFRVTPVQADILRDSDGFRGPYDAIISNPPYIPAKDLPGLMPEVRREPRIALDGGDGLKFYRAIGGVWVNKLAPGGFCAVEVGAGQSAAVAVILEAAGLRDIRVTRDYGGIERVVTGSAPENEAPARAETPDGRRI